MRRKGEQAAYNFARENFISHKTCEQISDMKHQGRGDAMDHLINGLIWAYFSCYLAEILSDQDCFGSRFKGKLVFLVKSNWFDQGGAIRPKNSRQDGCILMPNWRQ